MVMSIIHIAYITCFVTNDAYNVIGVHKIHHGAGRISYFVEPAMLRMSGTVMGEVGTHKPGAYPPRQDTKTIEYILYWLINRRR